MGSADSFIRAKEHASSKVGSAKQSIIMLPSAKTKTVMGCVGENEALVIPQSHYYLSIETYEVERP